MWDMFSQLYDQISEKIRQLSVIFLGKISEELAERKGFAIFVPDGEQTLLDSVDPVLDVLPTKQRPRSCHLIGASGRRVKFLLKGNEDLRVDERWVEYFALINTLLKSRYDLSIVCYSIQPLAPDAGLVQWVAGADTLQQIVAAERQRRGRPESPETAICEQFHHFASLDALQRLEVFEEVCSKCRALELFEWIWLMSPNAASWVHHVERFTTSMASMSMVGYILGIGDRHPGNVMVQKDTGSVVHIDFSDSFDTTVVRRAHPERVPFRLTRMIVNALEGSVTDGLFRRVCERVMEVLRKHRMTLGAHVVIFIGERAQMNTNRWCEPEHVTAARVVQKFAGTHLSEDGSEMSVRDHVKLLIEIAEDPRNYVRHFPGWCPFW
jgi:phosphatidylinositol kinase/protein kinase (PI-3  family)